MTLPQKRPLLMTVGMIIAALNAFAALVVTPAMLLSRDEVIANGKRMTSGYFAVHEFPPILVFGIMMAGISWSILKARPWSRHLVMAFWLFMLATAFIEVSPEEGRAGAMMLPAALLILSGMYFYLKQNVVAYYEEIAKKKAK